MLTLLPITIPTPLTGSEISLSSPALLQMQTSSQLENCMYNGTSFPAFTMGQTESGYTLVKNKMSLPASITLMDQTFNISTAGVLPLSEYKINRSSWFGGNTSIPAALDRTHFPEGLESSYMLMQQGDHSRYDTIGNTLDRHCQGLEHSGQQSVANITFSQFTYDCVVPQSARKCWTVSRLIILCSEQHLCVHGQPRFELCTGNCLSVTQTIP